MQSLNTPPLIVEHDVLFFQGMHEISTCYKTRARDDTSVWTSAQTSLALVPNSILLQVFSLFLELTRNKAARGKIDTCMVQSKLSAKAFRSDRQHCTTLPPHFTPENCII